jgi:ABC-type uncharacterized transport system permease subunit
LWAGIPGVLKARFGAHEVITTIMMNFIAAGLVSYLTQYHYRKQGDSDSGDLAHCRESERLNCWATHSRMSALLAPLGISFSGPIATKFGVFVRARCLRGGLCVPLEDKVGI